MVDTCYIYIVNFTMEEINYPSGVARGAVVLPLFEQLGAKGYHLDNIIDRLTFGRVRNS